MTRGRWGIEDRGWWDGVPDDQIAASIEEALALYRPEGGTAPASTLYWDANTGSDDYDGLTALTAKATLTGVLSLIPRNNATTVTVREAAHTVNWPQTLVSSNLITFDGERADSRSATITSRVVNANINRAPIALTVTGLTVSANELKSYHIAYATGAASARSSIVIENTATSLGNTTLYVNMDPNPNNFDTSIVDPGNVAITLTKPGTVHTLIGGSTILGSAQLAFRDIDWVGDATNRVLFMNATDQVSFRFCRFRSMRRPQVGTAARARFESCHFQTVGFTDGGMGLATNGGQLLMQWCVVDGVDATTNNYIGALNGGKVGFRGQNIFQASFLAAESGNAWTDGGVGIEDVIYFRSPAAIPGYRINKGVIGSAGLGGVYELPNLHGESGLTRAVAAANGAYASIGTDSTVPTSANGATKDVSAIEGRSCALGYDDTRILNGSPSRPPNLSTGASIISVSGSGTTDVDSGDWINIDPTSGPTIRLPASPVVGDEITVKNTTTSTTHFTVDGNGNQVEDIHGAPGSTASAPTVGGAGVIVQYHWVGSSWLAHKGGA